MSITTTTTTLSECDFAFSLKRQAVYNFGGHGGGKRLMMPPAIGFRVFVVELFTTKFNLVAIYIYYGFAVVVVVISCTCHNGFFIFPV